jgi:HK97 gp10 family phage protein
MARTSIHVNFTTRSRVREVSAEVAERLESGMEAIREGIAKDASDNAPVGDPATDPHSGQLRDEIHVDGDKVVSGAPHSLFVEKGTVFMPAQPFMAPAVQRGREAVKALLADIRRGL